MSAVIDRIVDDNLIDDPFDAVDVSDDNLGNLFVVEAVDTSM